MSDHHTLPGPRRHTALRIGACTVLGVIGMLSTMGCLLALFLANLSFFGERSQVPVIHMLLLLTGAVAGIGVPALMAVLALDSWRQRFVVAAVMLTVLVSGVLPVAGLLAS